MGRNQWKVVLELMCVKLVKRVWYDCSNSVDDESYGSVAN
jgi:hypothetical protein